MGTEFHVRVREVLQAAIQQLTADRAVFVEKLVGSDCALLREVQSLLPHYLEIAGFEPKLPMSFGSKSPEAILTCSHEKSQEDDEWKLPFAIAPYRVVEMVGRGGMGVVYRGIHSTRPLNVAIKILRRRFVDRGFILRRSARDGSEEFCGYTCLCKSGTTHSASWWPLTGVRRVFSRADHARIAYRKIAKTTWRPACFRSTKSSGSRRANS